MAETPTTGDDLSQWSNDVLLAELERRRAGSDDAPAKLVWQPLVKSEGSLIEMVERAVATLASDAMEKRVSFHLAEARAPMAVTMDTDLMAELMRNLVSHAVDGAPEGSQVRIDFGTESLRNGRRAADGVVEARRVSVQDTGDRYTSEQLSVLFSLRSRSDDDGSRLRDPRLVICERIVRDHRGTIRAAAKLVGGAVITVVLPVKEVHRPTTRGAGQ